MTGIDIISELKSITEKLDKLDTYYENIGDMQRDIDYRLCDLYHYIENNSLKTNECYRIIKEIKKQREQRRRLKNDYELLKVYKNNIQRLNNENNRKMVIADIHKTKKELGKNYKNRIYSEEELNEILRKKEVKENE